MRKWLGVGESCAGVDSLGVGVGGSYRRPKNSAGRCAKKKQGPMTCYPGPCRSSIPLMDCERFPSIYGRIIRERDQRERGQERGHRKGVRLAIFEFQPRIYLDPGRGRGL